MRTSPPNEDLFENSRMSFGEHLEELRKVLVRSAIGLGIGCVIGFFFANRVVEFLNRPLEKAISHFHVKQAEKRLVAKNGFLDPEAAPWLQADNVAPETVYVDPGEFVQMLRQVSPDFLEGVELQPYGFQAGHFFTEKIPDVCRRLSSQDVADQNHQSRLLWLWQQLDSQQQAAVRQSAVASPGTEDHVQSMIEVFDQLADLRDLSDAAPFKHYVQPSASTWWIRW